ncbi:MAG TPA: hypothetical protein VM253_03285 [Candidatus Limnocylindrales bacterium]|nr:hypothetical protein [Candidatus Limnocylindrales bacterium]
MDFSKLTQNEKLAVYGAIASIVGPVLASMGFGFGVGWLTLLLAVAMLAIVFLPQLSPQTTLPGSKGSLMVIVGGIAAISAALALVSSLGWLGFFGTNIVFVIGWLLGIAGGLLMGWAGWQEFQAEGGKLQLGTQGTSSASGTTPAPSEEPRRETTADTGPAPSTHRDEPATSDPVREDDRPTA